MNNKYEIKGVINDRWAVWYKDFDKKRGNRIGVYKIVDLYSGTRETKFVFRWKVKGNKTQEVFDEQLIAGGIRNFYKNKNTFYGTHGLEN